MTQGTIAGSREGTDSQQRARTSHKGNVGSGEWLCTMDEGCMPECCAQWAIGGRCRNTGGKCKFRKKKGGER